MNLRPFLPLLVSALAVSAAERISLPLKGSKGASRAPSLSADGRLVAFESAARLTADDTNTRSDVYVFDRTTKTTRLVSDDRGGDQPVISANGRFVAYRSFTPGLTVIRVRDLERGGPPLAASFLFDPGDYDRTAELATITPDGRFVAFVFRPAPNDGPLENRIIVADTIARTNVAVNFDPTGFDTRLAQVGRVALSADGDAVVFDTTDALAGDDINGASDVYRATIAAPSLKRLSKAVGVPDLGGATQPVFTLDGTAAFFLSPNPLTAADIDARPSIYVSRSADNFAMPVFVPTFATPKSLAAQATVSGRFIAYLTKVGRAYVLDPATGVDTGITGAGNSRLLAPVLSGDDRTAAYAISDVFTADVPGAPAARTPPSAAVVLSNGSALVEEGDTITIGASAAPHELLTIEVDGVEQFRAGAGNVAPQNFTPARGVHSVQARAFDDAWIEGRSAPAQLIVVPPAGTLGITGTTAFTRTDATDGSVAFSGTLRVDNRRATTTAALRVVVTLNATAQQMGASVPGGDIALVPDRGESILEVIDVPALDALGFATVNFAGLTPPPERIGDGYQGNGWTVRVRLREFDGADYDEVDLAPVLTTYTRLNENTNLPNNGIPILGPPSDTNFSPGVLQSLTINGPAKVGERGRATFTATANYSNGNRACAPQWSLTGANAALGTINSSGVFVAGNVSRPTVIDVQAVFGGQTATKPVTINPVVPRVSILVSDKTLGEAGDAGSFRILRTPVDTTDLTVNYTLTGKAENGTDYTTLSGTAVILARTSAVTLDVVPQQDATFEGEESVIATLVPDPEYRLSTKTTATLRLSDDEPFPADQPDLVLKRGRATVGSFVVDRDENQIEQTLTAGARKGAALSFTVSLINRGTTPRDFTLNGGAAAPGFIVQYREGKTDVTAAVTAGTYAVTQLTPGAARVLTLKITATDAAGLGSSQLCILRAVHVPFVIDLASVLVERVK